MALKMWPKIAKICNFYYKFGPWVGKYHDILENNQNIENITNIMIFLIFLIFSRK